MTNVLARLIAWCTGRPPGGLQSRIWAAYAVGFLAGSNIGFLLGWLLL